MPDNNDKTNKSTSQSLLWDAVKTPVTKALGDATSYYGAARAHDQLPLNSYSQQALDMTAGLARQPVPGLSNAFGFANDMLANNGMTADMRQTAGYLKPFADGSMQEDPRLLATIERERNNALNAAKTRMGQSLGSAGMGAGFANAAAGATDQLMLQSNENSRNRQLQASGMLGSMYQAGVGNAMQAGAMLPTLNNLQYDGASRLAGVGDFFQQRWEDRRNKPWTDLQKLTGAIGPFTGLGGTTVTTTPKQSPSLAQGILGGAATGGALFGPWGALGGGILGAFR